MGDEELDFSEIQQMFSKRDAAHEKEAQERRAQLKVVRSGPVTTQTEIKPVTHGLEYKKIELRDEPAYDDMRPTNLHVTEKGYQLAGMQKLALVVCGVVICVALVIMGYLGFHKTPSPDIGNPPGIVTMKPGEGQGKPGQNLTVINPDQCALSDFTIVLRQATPNVGNIVSVAERQLTEQGVDNRVVSSNADIASVINNIKSENNNREIIVINVDGATNKGLTETIIMTNYRNEAKSADNLALAMSNAGNDIYGIETEIRCGKKLSDGTRGETSVEEALRVAGHNDVVCLTVAPSMANIDTEIEANNLGTMVAEGVYRIASLPKDERYTDPIRRITYGDTLWELAQANGTTEGEIRKNNSEILAAYNGNLQYNTALLVGNVHANLTSSVTVNNKSITTNPSDITTKQLFYKVEPGDTISEIAEKLGIPASELVIPSGDPNKIYPGDKLGYETEVGKILVSKNEGKIK